MALARNTLHDPEILIFDEPFTNLDARMVIDLRNDILNFIGEEKPFRKEILDALKRLLAGQARTLAHGYIVIIETQTLDLPKELSDPKKYTIHIKMKWKSQSQNLAQTSGFIGGCADVHDHFRDFHCPDVVIRPPLTSYTV